MVQQKLASLGSLTAGIAHEIKNPLNFVTNFAEVCVSLVDEIRESLEQHMRTNCRPKSGNTCRTSFEIFRPNVSKIQEHGKRADGIVRNMLMHSRGQAGERQLTNLNSLVTEYVKLAYHGMRAQDSNFNVTIQENFDPSIEPVKVVAHDLSRVFLNIANNACYAAYEKKRRLGDGFSPTVTASTRNRGDYVEIRIRDNGDGIPDARTKKSFRAVFYNEADGLRNGPGIIDEL